MHDLVVGLFVGGLASRFGGIAKGNLRSPNGQTLLERLAEVCREGLPGAELVLVGRSTAYEDLGLSEIADSPAGIGPLGGLRALVRHGAARKARAVVALACDMPSVSAPLLRRIAEEEPLALALAPRIDGLWQPLCARYSVHVEPVLDAALAAGEHSLQRVFSRLGDRARSLSLAEVELGELTDWDRPDDVPGSPDLSKR